MSTNQETPRNLLEWIEEVFGELDSGVCVSLQREDEEYAELYRKRNQLLADFPIISALIDQDGEISLSAKEHDAYKEFDEVNTAMFDIERTNIYFLGQADCFAWLKRIGAL